MKSILQAFARLANMSDEGAKRIIRHLREENPYAAKRIVRLIQEVGKEDINVKEAD